MKRTKLNKLKDGDVFKRSNTSRTWFKIITTGSFGVVVTSNSSDYSTIMRKNANVFIKK